LNTLKRALLRLIAILMLLLALVYATDYISVRFGIPGNRDSYGTVSVRAMYVIHEKNGKVEYQFATPQAETCVHSLFPHFGYSPCWYLNRHTETRIDI